jgi:cell division transport system ATP-binding protein
MSRKPDRELAAPSGFDDAPMRSAAPIVRFEAVSAGYGAEPDILRGVTFDLLPGSFHFLTGPSGSGKTTLLRLIYLADRARRGRVELFGADVAGLRRAQLPALRRRIGVVFQEFRLLSHLSAFDNTALAPRIAGRRPASYRDDVAELLTWVGLGKRMDAMPDELSGGEKQRLAIARAVINRPEILIADEPTGNVDPATGARILRLFEELNRVGTTVFIASHDEDLVARSGRPALHLEDGRLVPFAGEPWGGAA